MVIEQKFKEGEEPDPTEYLFVSLEQKRKDQTAPYDGKTACWVPDEKEGFARGVITGQKGDLTTVKVGDEEKSWKKDKVMQVNPPKYEKAEDMSNLTYLNEGAVLNNLKQRYYIKLIYTYSGLFCVAINPYKRYPIYTNRAMKLYHGKRRNEVPPHIFAIADGAYSEMMTNHMNQSILITGESGAGKTENTKKVIAYFASVGASGKGEVKKISLEDQIVQTNPVLEAFGNAKTTRNDNSSRFGKFIRIHFGPSGKLAGGDIETYLLEKARVISQQPLERSYHMFYQIMSGFVPGLKQSLYLGDDIYAYHFVSQGKTTIPGVDDSAELEQTHIAFEILNFSDQERTDVYRVTAAVMHLGELKFKNQGEQAVGDETTSGECTGKLLGVKGEDIYNNFCKPRIKVGTEFVTKGQNAAQCYYAVGAISKAIYDRVFKFLVKKCNQTLDTPNKKVHFIGVLDIAGFEIFDYNGFEQLCINFTNEKLQQFFNHHMFVLEQEEYKKEGLDWIFEDFGMDLQACIDMMERPMGVFSILEEESMFPKATDQTFIEKLNINLLGKSPCFIKPRPAKPGQLEAHFGCVHYAGTVPYSITSWLEKNKDPLNDTLVDTLKKGTNALVHECFADHPGQSGGKEEGKGKGGKGSGFRTVSSSYREQLNNLMTTLRATHPHFIRCIIPNELKTPGLIDSGLVMHQLTCNGVLEGIRICRKGFPNRMLYSDFVFRYQILAANQMRAQKDDKKIAEACFDHIGLEANKWRVGHTKVFFRAGVLGEMEEIRDDKITSIMVHLQSEIRKYQTIKNYKKMADQRKALEVCQRTLKAYVRLRCWPWWGLWKIIKPKLVITDTAADMKKIEDRIAKSTEAFQGEEKKRKEEEQKNKKLQAEFDTLNKMMDELQGNASDFNAKIGKLNEAKADLDNQLNDMSNRLSMEEDARRQLEQQQKKMNQELARTKQDIEDNEKRFAEVNGDIAAKSKQIGNLNEEIQHQEELIHKQQKEKKVMQEQMQKTAEAAQIQEDKLNNLNKVKTKLERGLDELDDEVARNKKLRTEVEKSKNKLEGDLKLCQEAVTDLNRLKQELETAIQRKDKEIASLTGKIEDESALIAKLMRQIKELQARIVELEEELEAERNARAKATKLRADLARTLEELGESLEEAGGQTSVQIEFNKKREADISKLKREVEDTNLVHETQMANIRKKHNDTVSEMAEQVDNLNKMKAKAEKERSQCESELNDLRASMDQLSSEKAAAGKMTNILQQQIHELQNKFEQAAKNANEADMSKKKMSIENTDMTRQLEEVESQMSVLSKLKVSLSTQLEDTKKMADEEAREKATLMGKFRNVERDLDTLREQLDESSEGKGEILKQISKANADAQFYKTKYETEAVARCEELDESRRKLQQRLGEAEETIESLKQKSVHLERTRIKITQNIEEMRSEVDKSTALVQQAEKKQMHFDKILNEWKEKVQDLNCELDASRKEARNFGTELFRTKAQHEEIQEGLEVARRENKNLAEEVKDLVEQITEGGRNIHEIEKQKNRLQIEKEELQAALEEAESALEQEENKVLRVQLELSQIRQDIDRRIAEKEEEFENTRKNHMRTLESIQASLQAEQKAKNDTLSMKNKLEVEINELEIALDHSNKSNADAQRTIKRYLAQIQEFTTKIEEEQGARDAAREAYGTAERRANALAHELEESRSIYEQADRARRQGEQELVETRDHINDLSGQVTNLASIERKLKGELQAVHSDLEQILNEAKNSEEKAKKAMLDAARLADDLRVEQEYTQNHEKARKALESQIKDLQARLEYAENDAIKGARVHITALESKIRQVEQEIDIEQKRHIEAQKNMRKSDRRAKELQFQSEEDRKNHEKMQDLVDKLQQKIKTYKVQIEEAEEIAALNLAKFTKSQQECEEAIERCDQAEATLIKMRAKGRGGFM